MLIKLDIAKAYDNISWKYMEKMLSAYGFSREWVEWVMDLVTTPFFSILLNVSPTKPFKPSRGITQGDPMSHFLFILMVEGMSKLIQTHAIGGEIRGLSLHEGMEKQTHQQFMDDTILMGHPSVQEACAFKKSLTLFAKAYGLAINSKKYQVFFLNMAPIIQRNIVKILGFIRDPSLPNILEFHWGLESSRVRLGRI